MVFHWCQSDTKSSRFSKTFLSILADLSNVVFWLVSILPLISYPLVFQRLLQSYRLQMESTSFPCSTVLFSSLAKYKYPRNFFASHSLYDRFYFVHITFNKNGQNSISCTIPSDHLSYPVIYTLVFWVHFATFSYNVVNRFITVTKSTTCALFFFSHYSSRTQEVNTIDSAKNAQTAFPSGE